MAEFCWAEENEMSKIARTERVLNIPFIFPVYDFPKGLCLSWFIVCGAST